ncbi:P-loop containing nucleoside triphosphate hydrolase protein [Coniophora puteana RWD-64-598 SS2]|uniref:DNA 3'-5' helicase n=1 Tax=Coniophora puteana (strain RWD-64-598) TaxID=741705 RepID=A0A5M3MAI8_CONPW|nr:P-loop containing nucleoside triphosphate hydrolase protein [Coniophora puteana RWD-64-598 SS2]EIW75800.1 P-loop containing nucleoside triphosphate hydrolase protein [Coniophora puteana RWD-64-598 SS2]
MAMILPLVLAHPRKIAITVSPLKLLQQNHVEEFNSYGVRTIQINEDTPDNKELWNDIARGVYQNILVAPEQFFRFKGHIPRLASLIMRVQSFSKNVGHLLVDEGHSIHTTGFVRKGEKAPFRPAYSRLNEVRAAIPSSTPVMVLSATLPPPTLYTVLDSLRINPETVTKLFLSTNRPNHFYAVHKMHNGPRTLKNLDFLIPVSSSPNPLPKTLVFVDTRDRAQDIAHYLRNRFPQQLQTKRIVSHLHSGMSEDYGQGVFNDFKNTNEIATVIATSCASNGVDVASISRLVCYGLPQTLIDLWQEFGRAGRLPELQSIALIIAEPWAFNTEDSEKPSTAEKRTDRDVREYVSFKTCRRAFKAQKDGDDSDEALTTRYGLCCDNCNADFDLGRFFPRPLYDPTHVADNSGQNATQTASQATQVKPRKFARSKANQEEITARLQTWRTETIRTSTYAGLWPRSHLLHDKKINKIVKSPLGSLTSLASVVSLLQESDEWAEHFGSGVFDIIQELDTAALEDLPPIKQEEETDEAFSQKKYTYQIKTKAWVATDASKFRKESDTVAPGPSSSRLADPIPDTPQTRKRQRGATSQPDEFQFVFSHYQPDLQPTPGPSQPKKARKKAPAPTPSQSVKPAQPGEPTPSQPKKSLPKPRQKKADK